MRIMQLFWTIDLEKSSREVEFLQKQIPNSSQYFLISSKTFSPKKKKKILEVKSTAARSPSLDPLLSNFNKEINYSTAIVEECSGLFLI